jgi:hypothetical protein
MMLEAGRPACRGSERNGVESGDRGAYRGTYKLER